MDRRARRLAERGAVRASVPAAVLRTSRRPDEARRFAESELPFAVSGTYGGATSCVEIEADDDALFWIAKESNLRGLMLCYPQDDDVLDTLAWEGVREALDDIRYATLLRRLAKKAAASSDYKVANRGRIALQFFADIESTLDDPAALRREMIRHILDLLPLTGGDTEGARS